MGSKEARNARKSSPKWSGVGSTMEILGGEISLTFIRDIVAKPTAFHRDIVHLRVMRNGRYLLSKARSKNWTGEISRRYACATGAWLISLFLVTTRSYG